MEAKMNDNMVFVRLDDGEDIMNSLRSVAKQFGIQSGIIVCGIGMLKDVVIAYYSMEEKEYKKRKLSGAFELTSIAGNIAGDVIHAHVTLADGNNNVYGGHLITGKVCNVNELVIIKLDGIRLERVYDKAKGFMKLEVE